VRLQDQLIFFGYKLWIHRR